MVLGGWSRDISYTLALTKKIVATDFLFHFILILFCSILRNSHPSLRCRRRVDGQTVLSIPPSMILEHLPALEEQDAVERERLVFVSVSGKTGRSILATWARFTKSGNGTHDPVYWFPGPVCRSLAVVMRCWLLATSSLEGKHAEASLDAPVGC